MYQSKRRAKEFLIRELSTEIKGLVASNAAGLHWAVEMALEDIGFDCEREVVVPDRGNGHPGRVDLVARRGGIIVAMELDRATPRMKSIAKLRFFECDVRAIVLRTPARGSLDVPDGIDAVIGCGED